MTAIALAVLAVFILLQIGILGWFVYQIHKSDAKYEAELDRIYARKR